LGLEALDCRQLSDGITVKVKVQPRASRNAIAGLVGDSLKLALTSPPVEGAANAACISFFSDLCGVAKSRITITSGLKSRDKVIKITGIDKTGFFSIVSKRCAFD
jgi:uncharacterized protein (TIGR00251 family)